MGTFSQFPTCPPFSMLLSDYSQINLGDSAIKFSPCKERQDVDHGHKPREGNISGKIYIEFCD